jgi:3D (Asp-Asp-Asp) domain-containing protein
MSIVVTHARQVVIRDGSNPPKELASTAPTVEELLKQENIHLGEHDKINVNLQASLIAGQTIQITRREVKVSVADEKIPFQTERQPDPDMYTGQEKLLTRGVEGLARITTTVVTENGAEVNREQNRQVVQEPVSGVVTYGTKNRPITVASRSGANFTASKKMVMSATAYVAGGRTATGRAAEVGVAAVDPNVIPLGTRLYVEGYGYAIAADTGGAIKGNTIDLVFDTYQEAVAFGRRQVVVYILQ